MESNGAAHLDGTSLKKRKVTARAAGTAGRVDDDAPLPLSAVKKSKRNSTGTGRHESEFVSVEVGLREFHKRMASSGATPTKRAAAASSTKHVEKDSPRDDAAKRSTQVTKPTATRKKIAVHGAEDDATTGTSTSKRRVPIKAKAAVVTHKHDATPPAVKAPPKKRATPVKRVASTAVKPAASKPASTPSNALAQARAAAMQQQQERVQQRVMGLQRSCETPSNEATSAAVSVSDVPLTDATVAPPPPPPQLSPQQQHQQQPKHEAYQVSHPIELVGTEATASSAEYDTTQSSQGFIEEDFDDDLVFLQALEEVERKLQPTTISACLSPRHIHPAVSPALVPVPAATGAVHEAESIVASNASVFGNESKPLVIKQEEVQDQSIPELPPPVSAIPPELLAEYERLKRENEELRRSNDMLQAAKTTSPAGGQTTQVLSPTTVVSAGASASAETTSSGVQTASNVACDHELPASAKTSNGVSVSTHAGDDGPQVSNEVVGVSTATNASSTAPSEHSDGADEVARSTHEESERHVERRVQGPFEVEGGVDRDEDMVSVDGDSIQYGDHDADMGVGDDQNSDHGFSDVEHGIDDKEGDAISDEEGDDDVEEEEERGNASIENHPSTIGRDNYAQYRAKGGHEMDDEEDTTPDRVTKTRTAQTPNPFVSAASQKRPPPVTQPVATKAPIMPPPTVDDGSETESDQELEFTSSRHALSLPESSSSSSSSEESDDESAEPSASGSNVLEAALRAATGRPPVKPPTDKKPKRPTTSLPADSNVSSEKKRAKVDIKIEQSEDPPVVDSPSVSHKAKKRRAVSSSGSTLSAKDKSTLMWPTLDDFYDFVLDLTPRRVLHSDPLHLQLLRAYEKARARLPMHYSGIKQYCDVQHEGILEELLSSVRNAEQLSLHNSSRARLWLSSISPCSNGTGHSTAVKNAVAASASSPSLKSNVIFMESGFSGSSASGKNDFIVTFQDGRVGPNQKSALNDFVSGDLLAMRSPQWRDHDVYAFGIVLCSSVVAVGGTGSSHDGVGSSSNPDQLCVLIRAQSSTDDDSDAAGHFAAVMEMCLVNQRSAQWSWSLEQVHNLTTSAREFQAIKSVRFFKPDTKEMLMSGIIPEIFKSEQTQIVEPRKKLTSGLYEELETKFNPSQLQAILGAISDDSSISIIQGPPGTGKTKTILGVLSALLDGAALTSSRQAQVKSRIRIGASLEKKSSAAAAAQDKKSVAQDSIRVLVAAPSNAAVDELIVRLMSEGVYDARQRKSFRPRLVRVGRPESVQQQQQPSSSGVDRQQQQDFTRKKKWRKYASEVEEILLENLVNKNRSAFPTAKQARQAIIQNAQIVFCTLSGAGSVAMCELQSQHFDALVIDEAAQAVEASLLIPFKFQPGRVVLVGDHRQLPATVISKRLIELGYDRSLFQRLVENGSRVFMLTQQYRMHPEISWFPSTYFYNSKLIEAPQMKDWTARKYHREPSFRPFVFYDVLSGQQSQVSGSKSLRNVNEIECILVLLTRLVVEQFPEMEWRRKIGIIAPYKQQIYELRNELQRWEKKHDKRLDIEVNTVDGFQGREKEVIIYSCVRTSRAGQGRSSSRHNGQTIEAFWADERRMNVAITRAKSSLWIIGNSTLLKQSAAWRALITHAKESRRYISDSELLGTTTQARSSGSTESSSGPRSRDHSRERERERPSNSQGRSRDRSRSRDHHRK